MNRIYIVGIGPGMTSAMTQDAEAALSGAGVIIGYSKYVELIAEEFKGKELLSTPMGGEIDRCRMCFEKAAQNETVALVCSGDAGVYGLASLMYELSREYEAELVVIPGVTAALSGAALLGAPINNDFCVISLSDLMTSWERIENRLKAAAIGDFSVVIYNPGSHGRKDHLRRALGVMGEYVEGTRPCGWVRNIGRDGEEAHTCSFKELHELSADMFTTVFIGASNSKIIDGKLVTPRGYDV